MRVSCVVLPYISIQLNGQKPVAGEASATVISDAGELELVAATNDPKSSSFELAASSDHPATVNGLQIEPGQRVVIGRFKYGISIPLKTEGISAVRFTGSRSPD